MIDINARATEALDHHRAGETDAAEAAYRGILDHAPDHLGALRNLGVLLAQNGRTAEAAERFGKALAIEPDHPPTLLNLASARIALGHPDDARIIADRLLEVDDTLVPALLTGGMACLRMADGAGAASYLDHALSQDPDNYRARFELALAYLAADEISAAHQAFTQTAGGRMEDPPAVSDTDIAGPVLSDTLDGPAISEAFGSGNGIEVIDTLLSEPALNALRQDFDDRDIWRDRDHIDGFAAAYLETGLASPLLLRIAAELRQALPDLLGPHPLTQGWAFRGLTGDRGIGLHADAGAVSVNFWITPDSANRAYDAGGLILYPVLPPEDWRIGDYDADMPKIRAFLDSADVEPVEIPYHANRAVVFDSRLFHESGAVNFQNGQQNQRINVTLLYGYGVSS